MKKTIIGGLLSLIVCTTQAQFSKVNEKVYTSLSYREYDTDYELTRKKVPISVKWDNCFGSKDEVGKIIEFKTPKKSYKVVSAYQFRKIGSKGNEEWSGKVKDEQGREWDSDLIVYTDDNYIIFLVYETSDKYYTATINLSEFK
jgi:hypothetical protein